MRHMFGLVATVLALVSSSVLASGPRLKLTASPRLGMSPLLVSLRAEIHGDLTPEWMCPEVVWVRPDGTRASVWERCEVDIEPPRVWTRRERVAVIGKGGDVPFEVCLYEGETKRRNLLAVAWITVRVVGG